MAETKVAQPIKPLSSTDMETLLCEIQDGLNALNELAKAAAGDDVSRRTLATATDQMTVGMLRHVRVFLDAVADADFSDVRSAVSPQGAAHA